MFGIGPMELLLIMVVALLVLGPKRMPELARTLGRGLSEFRRASNDLRQSLALDEIQNDLRDGISGAGNLQRPTKRPEAEDRPAQAGDDLESGTSRSAATAVSNDANDAPGPGDRDAHYDEKSDEKSTPNPSEAATDDAGRSPRNTQPMTAADDLGNVPVGASSRTEPTDESRG